VNESETGYLDLIENLGDINNDDIPTYQVFCICQKNTYLALLLYLARENMNNWTWQQCCEKAILHMKLAGMKHASHPRTIMEWYTKFRLKCKFKVILLSKDLPLFLQQNPEICMTIKCKGKSCQPMHGIHV